MLRPNPLDCKVWSWTIRALLLIFCFWNKRCIVYLMQKHTFAMKLCLNMVHFNAAIDEQVHQYSVSELLIPEVCLPLELP